MEEIEDVQKEEEDLLDKAATKDLAKLENFSSQNSKASHYSEYMSSSPLYGSFVQFVTSDKFELAIGAVILFNTITMGIEAQYYGDIAGANLGYPRYDAHPPKVLKTLLDVINEILLWIFVMEIIAKLLALRLRFVYGKTKYWNAVDFFVVAFSIMDRFQIVDIGLDPMMLRLLRLVKLTRFLKLFKTLGTSLQTVTLILKSVHASQRTLFWSMLLLFMIQYIVGMTIYQLTTGFIRDDTKDISARKALFKYYGTFTKTQMTMFEITHVNYAISARLLCDHISEMWGWFFIFYRCTVAFAFLSVIRAVFIQSTLKTAERDRELLLYNKRQARHELQQKLHDVFRILFGEVALEDSFRISRMEFLKTFRRETTKVWMAALEVDISHPEGLFNLMDLDGDGRISLKEFIFVANKVRGPAQTIDLYYLQTHVEHIEAMVTQLLPEGGCHKGIALQGGRSSHYGDSERGNQDE